MSYTNVTKPGAQTYTTIGKPNNGFVIPKGTATGLLIPPTYATTHTIGSMYTNIAKPGISTGTLVQSKTGYTGSTPLTIQYNSNVTQGNLLVVCFSAGVNPNTMTISDDQSNTWTKVIDATTAIQGGVSAAIYYAVANGNNKPTISLGASDVGGSIYEYSGVSATNVSNATSLTGSGDFTPSPTATVLNTTFNSVIIAIAAQENAAGVFGACGGGFTLLNHNDAHIDAVADYQNAPPGSYAAVFNFDSPNRWLVLQVAFQLSANPWTNINKPT